MSKKKMMIIIIVGVLVVLLLCWFFFAGRGSEDSGHDELGDEMSEGFSDFGGDEMMSGELGTDTRILTEDELTSDGVDINNELSNKYIQDGGVDSRVMPQQQGQQVPPQQGGQGSMSPSSEGMGQ